MPLPFWMPPPRLRGPLRAELPKMVELVIVIVPGPPPAPLVIPPPMSAELPMKVTS